MTHDATKRKSAVALKTFGAKSMSAICLKADDVVVYGEDAKDFDALHENINAELKPRNPIERMWIQDIVYLHWEVLRYRRLKTHFLSLCRRDAMERILEKTGNAPYEEAKRISDKWIAGDEDVTIYVNEILENEGGGDSAVIAQVLSSHIDKIERIDRLMAASELRRDRMLHDLERRRADIAAPLARIIDQTKHGAGVASVEKK